MQSYRWTLLLPFLIITYGFMGGLANDIYLSAMPTMQAELQSNDTWIQLSVTAWSLGVGVLQLLMGPWSDHYGRRPLLLLGGLVFLLGSLGCAWAPNASLLLAARFIQGIGSCSIFLLALTCLKEIFDAEHRMKWLVYYNMVRSLAPLIGPVLGAYLLLYFNWQANFYFIFIVASMSLAGLWYALPETQPRTPHRFSWSALAQAYQTALRNRPMLKPILSNACIFGGLVVYLTSGAFILIRIFHWSPTEFAYSQAVVSGAYLLGASCIKPAATRWGHLRVIQIGILTCVMSLIALLIVNMFFSSPINILTAMFIYTFGFAFSSSPQLDRALALSNTATGLVAGLIGFSITAFSTVGSFIVSFLPESVASTASVMLVLTLIAYCLNGRTND